MKELEKRLFEVYDEIKADMPGLTHVSFEVSKRPPLKHIYGFVHEGNPCVMYDSIEDLQELVLLRRAIRSKNEILYRRF